MLIAGEQLPAGHFFAGLRAYYHRCVLLDPPWRFSAGTKSRPQHYPRMTDAEIMAMPIRELLHPEGAWVFMWVTSPKVEAAFRVARGIGLRYSGRAFVWIKLHRKLLERLTPMFGPADLHRGLAYTTGKNAEDCLLFRVGKPKRADAGVHEVIISPRREHSRKPDEAIARIERFCVGPRIELFARETRPGWDAWGNQKNLFDKSLPLDKAA
jgi:N6-adenosine-specific RNA methylase IME4